MKQKENKGKFGSQVSNLIAPLVAAGLAFTHPSSAHALFLEAMDIGGGGTFLSATGKIEDGDTDRIEAAFNAVPDMAILMIGSPGGDLVEAEKLGRMLRSMGINTIVDPKIGCFSACFVAFIGGAARAAPKETKLGSHQFYWSDDAGSSRSALSASQFMSARLLRYFTDMGVSTEALTLIMETKPEDMFIFAEPGLSNMRIVTSGPFDRRKPARKVLVDRCTGKVVNSVNPPDECSPLDQWLKITVPDFLKDHPEYARGSALYDKLDEEVRKRQAASANPYDATILEDAHRFLKLKQ